MLAEHDKVKLTQDTSGQPAGTEGFLVLIDDGDATVEILDADGYTVALIDAELSALAPCS
jgi:hypothetical protein